MDIVNAALTLGIPALVGGSMIHNYITKHRRWLESMSYDELLVADISEKERQKWLAKFEVAEDEGQGSTTAVPLGITDLQSREETQTQQRQDRTRPISDLTISAVGNLPEKVEWPVDKIRANQIPLLSDGKLWNCLNLYGSEHVVVCGASRSGKGYLLQLAGLSALTLGPDVAQVWFLDAKQGLDYSFATRLQHARLYADVKHSDGSLGTGFDKALEEMERRNNLLFDKARNIHEYAAKTGDRWPIILLIVDEAAELDKLQKEKLCKLARMSAASGFVLMTSTQYPTVDVLSSQIQANALIRICLKLPSGKYTPVALSLAPGESSTYDPASIEPRGVAIYRYTGKEIIGRIPEVTDTYRDAIIDDLKSLWSRESLDKDVLMGYMERPLTSENNGFGDPRSTSLHFTSLHFQNVDGDVESDVESDESSVPMPRSDTSESRSADRKPTSNTDSDSNLPQDPISITIRSMLKNGSTRNEVVADLGGSTSTAYKRIWYALGERNG